MGEPSSRAPSGVGDRRHGSWVACARPRCDAGHFSGASLDGGPPKRGQCRAPPAIRRGEPPEEHDGVTDTDEPRCRTCGAAMPAGSRFCPACGTPVEAPAAPVMFEPAPGGGGPVPGSAAAPGAPDAGPTPSHEGDEMRPITALFADIVGSTALGERLGPDEVKALVGECVSRMSRAVEEFGGTVQAYMGDGICAYFGVPAAHEDDEERAARAGMRIIQLVSEYGRDIEAGWGIAGFNVRVGINSGQVAVGLVGGSDPK